MIGSRSVVRRTLTRFLADSGQIALMCGNAMIDFFDREIPARSVLALSVEQVFVLGVRSITLVIGAGAAAGAIMALQLGYGLQRFGGNLYTPAVVGISILRELGPILTSLLLAGRIGSGITAELSSMAVTEQIDAIRALGTSPFSILVAPRIIACVIVLPALSVIADYAGIVSAMIVSGSQFSIHYRYFLSKTFQSVSMTDLFSGVLKTAIFGFLIAVIACWKGINTGGGTRGVGEATTEVVVMSSILILIVDVFVSKFYIAIGLFS